MGLPRDLAVAYSNQMMYALAAAYTVADQTHIKEGLEALNQYRCAYRGEMTEQEQYRARKSAIARLRAWVDHPLRNTKMDHRSAGCAE